MWKNRFFLKYADRQIEKSKRKKERFIHCEADFKGKNFRKWISPYVKELLHIKSRICGLTYEVIDDASNLEPDETVVYVGTHIGKYDWEMLKEALELYSYTIAGDWELMYGEFADYFFRLTGVIYVDTEDKKSITDGLPITEICVAYIKDMACVSAGGRLHIPANR